MEALKTALYALLSGDAELMAHAVGGVHDSVAPDGTASPFVVFQFLESATSYTLKVQIAEEFPFQVKAVCQGPDQSDIEDIMAQVDALLNNVPLSVAGKTTWKTRRVGAIPDYAEVDDGVIWRHVGARYVAILA